MFKNLLSKDGDKFINYDKIGEEVYLNKEPRSTDKILLIITDMCDYYSSMEPIEYYDIKDKFVFELK